MHLERRQPSDADKQKASGAPPEQILENVHGDVVEVPDELLANKNAGKSEGPNDDKKTPEQLRREGLM